MTPITDTMDVFAEKFEGVDLHGKKITKAEFDDCTFVSCKFTDAKNTMIYIRSNHLKGSIFSRYEALFLLESMGIAEQLYLA